MNDEQEINFYDSYSTLPLTAQSSNSIHNSEISHQSKNSLENIHRHQQKLHRKFTSHPSFVALVTPAPVKTPATNTSIPPATSDVPTPYNQKEWCLDSLYEHVVRRQSLHHQWRRLQSPDSVKTSTTANSDNLTTRQVLLQAKGLLPRLLVQVRRHLRMTQ